MRLIIDRYLMFVLRTRLRLNLSYVKSENNKLRKIY